MHVFHTIPCIVLVPINFHGETIVQNTFLRVLQKKECNSNLERNESKNDSFFLLSIYFAGQNKSILK